MPPATCRTKGSRFATAAAPNRNARLPGRCRVFVRSGFQLRRLIAACPISVRSQQTRLLTALLLPNQGRLCTRRAPPALSNPRVRSGVVIGPTFQRHCRRLSCSQPQVERIPLCCSRKSAAPCLAAAGRTWHLGIMCYPAAEPMIQLVVGISPETHRQTPSRPKSVHRGVGLP